MNIFIIAPFFNEEINTCLDVHSTPSAMGWRQVLQPLFVFFLFVLIVLSLFTSFARYLPAVQLPGYFFVLALDDMKLTIEKNTGSLLPGLPLAISTIYMAWGAGFLWSGISGPFKKHG